MKTSEFFFRKSQLDYFKDKQGSLILRGLFVGHNQYDHSLFIRNTFKKMSTKLILYLLHDIAIAFG